MYRSSTLPYPSPTFSFWEKENFVVLSNWLVTDVWGHLRGKVRINRLIQNVVRGWSLKLASSKTGANTLSPSTVILRTCKATQNKAIETPAPEAQQQRIRVEHSKLLGRVSNRTSEMAASSSASHRAGPVGLSAPGTFPPPPVQTWEVEFSEWGDLLAPVSTAHPNHSVLLLVYRH